MTLRMNRETGKYEAEGSFKFWLGLAGVVCTVATAVITYTITLTMAFSGVRQDIALLKQLVELQQKATDGRLAAVEGQLNAVAALAAAVQANTAAIQGPRRAAGSGGQP